MNKKNYKHLLFDADNTLFDFTYSQRKALHICLSHFGYEFNENIFETFTKTNYKLWKAFDNNEITHEEIKLERFRAFFDVLQLPQPDLVKFNDMFIEKLIEHSKLLDGSEEFIVENHNKFRLYIITNGMKEVQRPRFENLHLKNNFKDVFISGEMGKSKPNRDFFQHVFDTVGDKDKSNYLVIGDNPVADVQGGKEFGFDTCWFNPHGYKVENREFIDFEIEKISELNNIIE